MKENNLIIVLVTVADKSEAKSISSHIVEKRLAACSNIIPNINSIYHWENKIEDSSECLLIFKTIGELFPELEKEIKRIHSYKVPEIIAISASRVFEPYLNWVIDETKEQI